MTKDQETLNKIKKFVIETESEHDTAGDILRELAKVTHDYQTPRGACTTFKLVYTKLDTLEKDLFRHIYLENSVLFEMLQINIH
jgi:regulator of cell morphogenesis and NO signaling